MSTLELPALYVDSVALVVSTPRLVVVNRDPSPGETGVPVDATLALVYAVEIGLNKPSIPYDEFKDLYDALWERLRLEYDEDRV